MYCPHTGWACKNHVAPSSSHVRVHVPVGSAQRPRPPVSERPAAAGCPVWRDGGGGGPQFSGPLLRPGLLQWILPQPGRQRHQAERHHHVAWRGQCLNLEKETTLLKCCWVSVLEFFVSYSFIEMCEDHFLFLKCISHLSREWEIRLFCTWPDFPMKSIHFSRI